MPETADLLPAPLFIIYSQLVAAREALHINCNTKIEGNLDEAHHFASAAAAPEQPMEQDEDPYKVSDAHYLKSCFTVPQTRCIVMLCCIGSVLAVDHQL